PRDVPVARRSGRRTARAVLPGRLGTPVDDGEDRVKAHWRVLGTLVLVAVLAWRIDWGQLAGAFARLHGGLWLLAVGGYLLAQLASAWRWHLLARVVGLAGPLLDYLRYYFVGMFFNLVLPTSVGGDVVRVWYLARQEGPAPPLGRGLAAFVSVLADRFNGVL